MKRKITSLAANLVYAQANLQRAHKEITKLRDLYYNLRKIVVNIPILASLPAYPSNNIGGCYHGVNSYNTRPSSSSGGYYMSGP